MSLDLIADETLLALCAAPDADLSGSFARLSAAEWRQLADTAWPKRVTPLLKRAMLHAGAMDLPPADVVQDINARAKWHRHFSMQQSVAVRRLVSVAEKGGFNPVFLKGLSLAYRDYPEPALRPLRDVDLLLDSDEVERAQVYILAQEGYVPAEWAGTYGIDFGHQLPEIRDEALNLTIELHHRINARGWLQEGLLVARLRDEAEPLTVAGAALRVPSARANFLHLLEHATLHHAFENGPMVLADLHFVASANTLDWAWIEEEAQRLGLTNSLHLVAAFAYRYGATWVPASLRDGTPAEHLAATRQAILQSATASQQNKLVRRLSHGKHGKRDWLAPLARALNPNREELAKIIGLRSSNPLRWLAYPIWLVRRGQLYLGVYTNSAARLNAEREAEMVWWLQRK